MADKTRNIVSTSRKQLVDEIVEAMGKGDLFWNRPWNKAMCMPQNPVSNVRYARGNRVRLMYEAVRHEWSDPRFVTFTQASKNGWKVKKGEHGFFCEKWIYHKLEERINPKTGEKEKVLVELTHPRVSYFYVFNASQIEGIPELPAASISQDEEEMIDTLIRASPCPIKEVAQTEAYYLPDEDYIVTPPRGAFGSINDYIKTLCHEMIHATGAPGRLGRDQGGHFGSETYAREELRAELGATFLAASLGLPTDGTHMTNHAAYIKHWMASCSKDPNELFMAASDAEKAADYIIKNMEKNLQIEDDSPKQNTEQTGGLNDNEQEQNKQHSKSNHRGL